MTFNIKKTCQICKARRNIKYMKITSKHYYNSFHDKYVCADQYCGEAWLNKHYAGKLLVVKLLQQHICTWRQ